MKPIFIIALVGLPLVVLVSARRVDACSDDAETGVGALSVLPADGSLAPRNTKIWVPPPIDYFGPIAPADISVIVQGGFEVTTNPIPLAIQSEADDTVTVWVLEPTAPLAAGAFIDVVVKGKLASTFTVTSDEDTTAPTAPTVTAIDVASGYFGGFSCGGASRVTVAVASPAAVDEMLLLTEADVPTTLPADALAIAGGDSASAVDLVEGKHALHVIAVDVAGNLSAATKTATFTIPTEQTGCNAAGRTGWPVLVLLAFVLRRRRR